MIAAAWADSVLTVCSWCGREMWCAAVRDPYTGERWPAEDEPVCEACRDGESEAEEECA